MQLLQVLCSTNLSFPTSDSVLNRGHTSPKKSTHPPPHVNFCVASQRHEGVAWLSHNRSNSSTVTTKAAPVEAGSSTTSTSAAEKDVLKALSQIIDPDFGTDIVSCGFVKDLLVDETLGEVSFRLELTTPACPIKDMFEQKANEVVSMLPWVTKVNVTMSAQPARPVFGVQLPIGLQTISNFVAVSSCKGGVGKSTVAVNLAYTLAGMGARVGVFDADVYGPSLPTMVSPENRLLVMNPEKGMIIPIEYLGVKLVSFGFAGQGRAIMRGPMVSGVINQLLTTTEWGELDYLVIDMPPGTGDIQLTLCQVVPLTAAVIVTTPQKLAFIDVAKGVRMFSKLKVPCVAVVENMCHFDADGKRYYPFGRGSGSQVIEQFGIPHLFDLPIRPTLSASGDSGMPEVVADPQGEVAKTFQDLGVRVVQQCAKIRQQVSTAVTYDNSIKAIKVKVPDSDEEFLLHPATVRRNDRSAQSVDEWTGEQKLQYADVPEDIEPEDIQPMGNYAVSITWPDGFSQIAPYDQLQTIERLVDVPEPTPVQVKPSAIDGMIGHYLSGPFRVVDKNGVSAKPGDLLAVEICNLGSLPGSEWGYTGSLDREHGGSFLADHFPAATKAIWYFDGIYAHSPQIPGVRFPGITHPRIIGTAPSMELLNIWNERERELEEKGHKSMTLSEHLHQRPFACLPTPEGCLLGKIEVGTPEWEKIAKEAARTIPGRENGGNCDIKNLSTGSKIYLPVFVDGAKFSTGDMHFSQGDGEVLFCGAIEMNGFLELKCEITRGGMQEYLTPMGPTPLHVNPIFDIGPIEPRFSEWLVFEGVSVDENGKQHYLDASIAFKRAVLNAIDYISKFGYSREQVYLLLSACPCEGRISGIVDSPNACVTLAIPTAIFDQDIHPKPRKVPVGPRVVKKPDVMKLTYDGNLPTTKNASATA